VAKGVPIKIERITSDGWERLRAVRLRALADTPDAFGMTLAEDEARLPEDWQMECEDDVAAMFFAVCQRSDVGFVVGDCYSEFDRYTHEERVAGLFWMWVAPEARGRGTGGALIEAVIGWARQNRYRRISLDVGNENAPAIQLYKSKGFLPTGNTSSLPPPREHIHEHERVLALE